MATWNRLHLGCCAASLFVAGCAFHTEGLKAFTGGPREMCLDWVLALDARMRACNYAPSDVDSLTARDTARCEQTAWADERAVYEQCIPEVEQTPCDKPMPARCEGLKLWWP